MGSRGPLAGPNDDVPLMQRGRGDEVRYGGRRRAEYRDRSPPSGPRGYDGNWLGRALGREWISGSLMQRQPGLGQPAEAGCK